MTLESLEKTIRRIANKGLVANEETVKFRIVTPILEELGWDIHDLKRKPGEEEVEFELAASSGSQSGRADICLISDTKRRHVGVVVEVKRSNDELRLDDKIDQIIRYAFGMGGKICVLTNGRIWKLFLPSGDGAFDKKEFAELNIYDDDVSASAKELWKFLLRLKIRKGTAVEAAEKQLNIRQRENELRQEVNKVWKDEFDGILKVNIPNLMKAMIDEVHVAVNDKFKSNATLKEIRNIVLKKGDDAIPEYSLKKSKATSKRKGQNSPKVLKQPDHFFLFGDKHKVKYKKHYGVLKGVCQELFDRHPDAYEQIARSNFNMKTIRIAPPASIPGGGSRIAGTPYALHSKLNSSKTREKCFVLLRLFGYSDSVLRVPAWEE